MTYNTSHTDPDIADVVSGCGPTPSDHTILTDERVSGPDNEKILFVDDDVAMIEIFVKRLRKKYNIEIASKASEGLHTFERKGPFAVVVSDIYMPGMDGIEFLEEIRNQAPETVRMLHTSASIDTKDTAAAVNRGRIFRFLTKPSSLETLSDALEAGLHQFRLITAERELLDKTLRGTTKLLIDILGIVSPNAFSKSLRFHRLARRIASRLPIEDLWTVEIAALLSQIGCVTLPQSITERKYAGKKLTSEEERLFGEHIDIGNKLLANIPRMEKVAEAIAYQHKCFNGAGNPDDSLRGYDISLAARVLKIAHDFDALAQTGISEKVALERMRKHHIWYDPELLAALEADVLHVQSGFVVREVTLRELEIGMVLADDIRSKDANIVLVPKDHEISEVVKARLQNFERLKTVQEPIKILQIIDEKR